MSSLLPKAALLVAALTSVANADLQVTRPSSDIWWVAKSNNVIAWTCQDTDIQQFTVLIGNVDPQVQTAPGAIIGIQNNFDCSILLNADQFSQGVGTGWQVLLADIFNNTHVYATSQPFEIKPQGSPYPDQGGTTANATATNNTQADSNSNNNTSPPNKPSGAMGVKAGMGGLFLGAAVAVAGMVL
ncbi:hypothetical protein CPC08DRAFT_751390 [Agrocybe pediades]|nr:hypothetical protein CPC08DRAFT_751390 [Agrocybe pediades]